MSHAAEYKHCRRLSILENKRGKGLWQFSQGLPHSDGHRGGPPPLLRRDFFRPQGDGGPGGVGLHYAWPGQPGWRSAWQWGPSAQMSAHTERTLESDGKRRQGGRKKKKSRIFTVKAHWSDHWGIYWRPAVDLTSTLIPIFTQGCNAARRCSWFYSTVYLKKYKIFMYLWPQMAF